MARCSVRHCMTKHNITFRVSPQLAEELDALVAVQRAHWPDATPSDVLRFLIRQETIRMKEHAARTRNDVWRSEWLEWCERERRILAVSCLEAECDGELLRVDGSDRPARCQSCGTRYADPDYEVPRGLDTRP